MNVTQDLSAGPVTVAMSRRIAPGRESEFADWAQGISAAAALFPGHLGAGHIRPADPSGEHTIIYRFDTKEDFDRWQGSDERAKWMERSRDLIIGEPKAQVATGLEFWFHDPACSYGTPPPAWKQALLTWVGLYPTVLLIAYTVGLLISAWAVPVRSILTTALSVLLMTWVVMPNVTRIFRRFLQPVHMEG